MDKLRRKEIRGGFFIAVYLGNLFSVSVDLGKISKNELDHSFTKDALALFKLLLINNTLYYVVLVLFLNHFCFAL